MRVIAGALRGRRIVAPLGDEARPTSDRARQATFNRLESMDLVDGAVVLDLFAGSGALGIEALSRGAAQVVFVDSSRRAIQTIRTNLDSLDLHSRYKVVQAEGVGFAAGTTDTFDVALLDPPYEFDRWDDLLAVVPAECAVVESDRPVEAPDGWVELKSSRYGRAHISVLEREER